MKVGYEFFHFSLWPTLTLFGGVTWFVATKVSNLSTITKITLAEVVERTSLVLALLVSIHSKGEIFLIGTASVHH